MYWRLLLLLLLSSWGVAQASVALPPAYAQVAADHQIPPALLYSVALTESNHPDLGKPWPWTINCEGTPFYFNSLRDAVVSAAIRITAGRSCDIGLMQVNWRWNGHRFNNLSEAFDPMNNLRVGAEILTEHYRRLGSWAAAVGAYHSPGNPVRAYKYRTAVTNNLVRVLRRDGGLQ